MQAFPFVCLWVWMLDVFILFVPSLDGIHSGPFFGGLVEQLAGICCNHLLVWVFGFMYFTTSDATKADAALKVRSMAASGSRCTA